jgi:ADP-glucose pyrophosphorylase
MAAGERIAAHVGEGMWYELSTLRRYLDISLALLEKQGSSIYAGAGSDFDYGEVTYSVLWNNVTVEAGARVAHAVIGDGVHIRSNQVVQGAIVVRADLVAGKTPPAKAMKGSQHDDQFVVVL